MTLVELLDLVNLYYDDGYLANYYDPQTGEEVAGSGDTLALFIVRELRDIFDEEAEDGAQLCEAIRALDAAATQLHNITDALENPDTEATPDVA